MQIHRSLPALILNTTKLLTFVAFATQAVTMSPQAFAYALAASDEGPPIKELLVGKRPSEHALIGQTCEKVFDGLRWGFSLHTSITKFHLDFPK